MDWSTHKVRGFDFIRSTEKDWDGRNKDANRKQVNFL